MEQDLHKEEELVAAVNELIKDDRVKKTFGLSGEQIHELMKVKVTSTGFDVNPNFQSSGWGENESDSLVVNLSDIGNSEDVLKHELKHALHCIVCSTIFRGESALEMFRQFAENVINDPGFFEWRDKFTGSSADKQWEKIQVMISNNNLTSGDVNKNALMLGSVLYQHAYYVDPLICEAVASTNDEGFTRLNGALNRVVGILIPGDQYIEGYGWREAQDAFGRAPVDRKTLLIKKEGYQREEYFRI